MEVVLPAQIIDHRLSGWRYFSQLYHIICKRVICANSDPNPECVGDVGGRGKEEVRAGVGSRVSASPKSAQSTGMVLRIDGASYDITCASPQERDLAVLSLTLLGEKRRAAGTRRITKDQRK